ncbi:MAG: tetratricopeptide repeat protein [Proteobacteria bacterium]|nr:tetratricopeptide repeat protein [Pseudomonadota bacterium]
MNLAVAMGLIVLVGTVVAVWLTIRYMRTEGSSLPAPLVARRESLGQRLDAIVARVPDRIQLASDELPNHPGAASIEAKLLSGDRRGALRHAEGLLSEAPDDSRVRVLLARVLMQLNQLEAAWAEIRRARSMGESGPMLDYLEGRAHHLRVLRQLNPKSLNVHDSPVPSMIAPFEMFMLQLERQRQRSQEAAALWLASMGDGKRTLGHDEIAALITDYFSSYYDSLDRLLAAAERAPSFTDALYHTARLALKVGFIRQGFQLMSRLEPLMENHPEKPYYERDLAELHGTDVPVVIEDLAPVTATARRSRSLKVLS